VIGEPRRRLLMLPGPTNVSDRVMQAMQRPIMNHRGDGFRALYRNIESKSRHLFQTDHSVAILSSSGTGGVEAAVWNLIREGDTAIVPVFGEFSGRLAETIDLAGGHAIRVEAEPGTTPSLDTMREVMERQRKSQSKLKAVFLVHNETSTGVTIQYVKEVCQMAKEQGAFMVVDAISSLGGYSIPVDGWGIDICVTGSQKCIAAPPGLALVSVSDAVVNYLKDSPARTRYFDLARQVEYGAKNETPFTPALPLFYALDEALTELLEEGLAARVARHQRMSDAIYAGIEEMGLKPTASRDIRSRTVVAVTYPAGVEDAVFRKTLDQEHDVVVAGGFGRFSGKVFRIGCMGLINEEYVQRTLAAVSRTVEKLRHP
jgi:aspartate aminotransferase-like enzyme